MATIADRLASKARRVVGREDERALFLDAVCADELPFVVLSVFGPGGIGKTTLLGVFSALCAERAIPCTILSGRELAPTPEGFHAALSQSDFDGDSQQRQVLCIDTYENVQPLEGWLRTRFLPELGGETLVVLAGRKPVAQNWRSDSLWSGLVRTVPLRNLSPGESREYLTRSGIPDSLHENIVSSTHGFPLALTISRDLFEQQGAAAFDGAEPSPDMVSGLIERLVDEAPSHLHRLALEASSLPRTTTEPILARLLDLSEDDIRPLFPWLANLSLMEVTRSGVAPHTVARDALLADVRWRNPDRWAQLHRRARNYYSEQLATAADRAQQRLLADLVFLHRDDPVIKSAFTWHDSGAYADRARPDESALLSSQVEAHEGPIAAARFRHWWNSPAQTTVVFRGGDGNEAQGFLMWISLEKVTPDERAQDPLIDRAMAFLESTAPLRPGETAIHFRFWMAHETYHAVSPIQSLVMVNVIQQYLVTSRLAYSFFPVRDPERWQRVFAYAESPRCPAAESDADGFPVGIFAHDWRAQPVSQWLQILGDKEIAGAAMVQTRPAPAETLLVLNRSVFDDAVREVFKYLDRPEALVNSPLLRSRVVAENARESGAGLGAREKASVLQHLIRSAASALQGHPKRERGYRALLHTYLRPAATQEKAAEALDLPFSTYRRHLAEGIHLVCETLWLQEIGESQK